MEIKSVKLPCKHCGKVTMAAMPKEAGYYSIACSNPQCGQPIKFQFSGSSSDGKSEEKPSKNQHTVDIKNFLSNPARLVIKRFGGLKKEKYTLKTGNNIVGRQDDNEPSDFNINSDNSMSRRSIDIYVDKEVGIGYKFQLKVLRSTNPVMHNGRALNVGDSLYLRYGDKIVLGTTTIFFEEISK